MVKADAKRDYYADLELSPDADDEQIKRQFKLLAKQYHPDRNLGHEIEFVSKFQEVQAAHEILTDPIEKAKYDAARAKLQRQSESKFPPSPRDDPYNFRKPTRAATTHFAPPPRTGQQAKSTPQQPFASPRPAAAAPSPGADKMGAFARGAQRWDRAAYEEAARNEGMRGFQRMPAGGPPPQMPPRPSRQHPTAPRPPSATASPDTANGANPGFPGLSRTNSARRMHFPDEKPTQRSAYAYVRGDRGTSSAGAHTYDAFTPQSPYPARAQAANHSPLRHTRSTEQTKFSERPGMYDRQTSRYASNVGEKTDIRGNGPARSASVRNSPVDRAFDDDSGPFGNRPRSHYHEPHSQPPPTRHRSASPVIRQPTVDTSSSGSEDEPVHAGRTDRPKAEPKSRRRPKHDGLDGFFPSSNYTRIVDNGSVNGGGYRYPPPLSKDVPTRHPFPDMTSPNEPYHHGRRLSTSDANAEQPLPETVFKPATFQHEDWAERLRQERIPSPSKQQRTSRARDTKRPTVSTSDSSDAMEIDRSPTDTGKPRPRGNINLDDLKTQVPLTAASGLDGVADDLMTNLPFESRAGVLPDLHESFSLPQSKLKISDLPRPPKLIHPPTENCLNRQNWQEYVEGIKKYVESWAAYEEKMIDHFHTRNRMVRTMMAPNWVTSTNDGPAGDQVDDSDFGTLHSDKKAGYGTYMEWLADDRICHAAWDTACERHRGCMEELGKVRDKIKRMGDKS